MEVDFRRENLRFEYPAASAAEQVTIEGECALAGSMRDAVTILSVQARAHVLQTQLLADRLGVKGRVGFQVLYTQGDLTRIRSIETTCEFTHELAMQGAAPGMRVTARAAVLETNGTAASGRISLRAHIRLEAQTYETDELSVMADAPKEPHLCTMMQQVKRCLSRSFPEETAIVREEYDLPDRLQVQGVLCASGTARVTDITGGNGRVGVSGVVEVQVLHQPQQAGEALVVTTHEAPFQTAIDAQLGEEERPFARAEVIDVMADSVLTDKQRTMRVEAEVRVRLHSCMHKSVELLADLYSTQGPLMEPQTQEIAVLAAQMHEQVRESVRIQASLPQDAPPIETVLAAFAHPAAISSVPAGRRLNVEGVMNVTLVYLPVDSDIPYAVRTREPFSAMFPVEAKETVAAQLDTIECSIGPATSDRAELRCVLGLCAVQDEVQTVRVVTDVTEKPEEKQEHGFVLVWPAPGESRWDTARRLRVAQEGLQPAGTGALLAFRR